MTNINNKTISLFLTLLMVASSMACNTKPKEHVSETNVKPTFTRSVISDSANLWWARCLADVDGDGILDVPLQDNNGFGGWLGYLKGNTDGTPWKTVIVKEQTPTGNLFAAGDLEVADLDGDGKVDLIGVEHPGEWQDAGADAILYWYKNPTWEVKTIGTIPSALKDISIGDLNKDGKPEIITATFDAGTLSIFSMNDAGEYETVQELVIKNLHEGMDLGDVNGDGHIDIATNGYWLPNPGSDLKGEWKAISFDSIWHNQDGDWSANATKTVCRDMNGDGKAEIFSTHSERDGYPLAMYTYVDDVTFTKKIILDTIPAAHNLQVVDIDLDGDDDIVTGVNTGRAVNININTFPVYILYNQGDDKWEKEMITDKGVYNMLVGDLEGDGDIDLFRLETHDGKLFELFKNKIR